MELIDRLYPKEGVPDPINQEAMGHKAYAKSKLLTYVARPVHSTKIDAFMGAEPNSQGLVITGESGVGKTALLADWVFLYRKAHPDHFVIEHYFGATSESTSAPGFLRRLLGELKRRAKLTEEIPIDPKKMAEVVPLWLSQTIGKIPHIVLVLDALNQIEGGPSDKNLSWLPRFFPNHIQMIASSRAGPELDALRDRGWSVHSLPLANTGERGRMIDTFLNVYRKNLCESLREQIIHAKGTANPLFLHTILEELRQFGSFEQLPHKVQEYLQATTPMELFRRVIRRWQADFHPERDVVSRSLCHLWAVRHGIGESEWLDLLADEQGPMDRQTWRPLFLSLTPHLVNRSGLWAAGHDYLKQAIEAELLSTEEARQRAHLTVADYFELHLSQKEMSPRKADEWPWQLHAAESWDRLEDCLTDRTLFLALYNNRTKWSLIDYWHPLRSIGILLGERYAKAFNYWIQKGSILEEDFYSPRQLGAFLLDNGCYSEAEHILRIALENSEKVCGKNDHNTLRTINILATLLYRKGNYVAAEPLYRRALEGAEQVLGKNHPNTLSGVNNLASLLQSKGDFAAAEALYCRALEGTEQVLGKNHPAIFTSVNNLAGLLHSKGDYVAAEPLYRHALVGSEQVLGKDHPDTLGSVNNLAGLLHSKGDYVAAEPLYRRALVGFEQVLGKDHPDTLGSVNNLASLLQSKGDYAAAEALCRRALEGREQVLGKDHPDTLGSVNNLASLLESKGDYAAAEGLCRRALEEGREQVLGKDHPDTLGSVNNLASLLESKGDYVAQRFRNDLKYL